MSAPATKAPAENTPAVSDADLIAQWRTAIGQIEHFNDLSRRARTNTVTVVMAAYGGAAVSLVEYPAAFLALDGAQLHVSLAILVFALTYLGAFWAVDMLYYYRMLVAAVRRGRALERANKAVLCGLLRAIGRATPITYARRLLHLFYAAPFALGILFALFVALFHAPPPPP